MHAFWRHSNNTIKFKITVMQAVLFSKILFGLESAELTAGALRALDTFHLKCLRKILKMKTTFIERANSNEEVYRRAREALGQGKVIKPLSELFLERKQKFFKQVVVAEEGNPIRDITFVGNSMKPHTHFPRRVGRPRANWARKEGARIWDKSQKGQRPPIPYDENSEMQGEEIRRLAKEENKKRKR